MDKILFSSTFEQRKKKYFLPQDTSFEAFQAKTAEIFSLKSKFQIFLKEMEINKDNFNNLR